MKKYKGPFILSIVGILFLGIPWILVLLNPVPPLSQLSHFHAKILVAQTHQPNLIVMTDDGRKSNLGFPTPLYNFVRSNQRSFSGISAYQQSRLTGCDAQIYIFPLRYVWPETDKVWQVDCRDEKISFNQIASVFSKETKEALPSYLVFILLYLLFTAAVTLKIWRTKK
jgi:hypothetical protein